MNYLVNFDKITGMVYGRLSANDHFLFQSDEKKFLTITFCIRRECGVNNTIQSLIYMMQVRGKTTIQVLMGLSLNVYKLFIDTRNEILYFASTIENRTKPIF